MKHSELKQQFERGEINFEQFMTTPSEPDPRKQYFKGGGKRAAAKQGAIIAPRTEAAIQTFKEMYGSEPLGAAIERTLEGNEALGKFNRTGEQPSTPLQAPLADAAGPFVAAPGNLKTAETALKFILAGNAYFTVRSLKTGTRYTFRVNKPKPDENKSGWNQNRYFVALLTGPENTSDYSYLGMIQDNRFKLTRASKLKETSTPVLAFRWVFEHLMRKQLPPQTEIWHEGRCGRCGRPLTVPESIEAGIGPVCEGM